MLRSVSGKSYAFNGMAVLLKGSRVAVVGEAGGEPVRLIGQRWQNPCDGMRSARLKRKDVFSHAMIIISSAMVSSSFGAAPAGDWVGEEAVQTPRGPASRLLAVSGSV